MLIANLVLAVRELCFGFERTRPAPVLRARAPSPPLVDCRKLR